MRLPVQCFSASRLQASTSGSSGMARSNSTANGHAALRKLCKPFAARAGWHANFVGNVRSQRAEMLGQVLCASMTLQNLSPELI